MSLCKHIPVILAQHSMSLVLDVDGKQVGMEMTERQMAVSSIGVMQQLERSRNGAQMSRPTRTCAHPTLLTHGRVEKEAEFWTGVCTSGPELGLFIYSDEKRSELLEPT